MYCDFFTAASLLGPELVFEKSDMLGKNNWLAVCSVSRVWINQAVEVVSNLSIVVTYMKSNSLIILMGLALDARGRRWTLECSILVFVEDLTDLRSVGRGTLPGVQRFELWPLGRSHILSKTGEGLFLESDTDPATSELHGSKVKCHVYFEKWKDFNSYFASRWPSDTSGAQQHFFPAVR